MSALYNTTRPYRPAYRHFESIEGVFYNNTDRYKLLSVNGFAVDSNRLEGDFRISRFVRDPRDLIVSGYYYHKRGAEPWFRFKSPTEKYWSPINGSVPPNMSQGISFAEYLQQLSLEDGLIAEIQFRKYQLESIRNWPSDDRIKIFKYENILGNEAKVFDELFRFYELPLLDRKLGIWLAKYYAYSGNNTKNKHIRNPAPRQWKAHFTDNVAHYFNERYQDIIVHLGYGLE